MECVVWIFFNGFLPIQFLGPALKGMKANGCLVLQRSGRKLSGSKLSGLGKLVSSRWTSCICILALVPAGTKYPSKERTDLKY